MAKKETAEEKRLREEQEALDAEGNDMGTGSRATDGQPSDPTNIDDARKRRGRTVDAGESGEGEPQQEIPLDMPGARKPSLAMNAKGKPVSVEGKMRGKSFKMSGVVDDTDKVIEARVLIRFHQDKRVPVRDGTGEAAVTQSFVLRQEFDVLRMDIIEPTAAATG